MREYLRNFAAAGFAIALLAGATEPALAHAVILAANPAAEQRVAPGKLPVRIEFNSRIDKERSRLQLTAPDGGKSDIAIEPEGEPNVISGTTADLAAGAYVLRWQVLAIDGHITRGDIPFAVGN
jgi:copper resistance protein C